MEESQTSVKPLNGKKLVAAQRVAEDLMIDKAIAEEAGVSRQTLGTWKKTPLFAATVAEIRQAIKDRVMEFGVANVANQIQRLDLHRKKLLEVFRQREDFGPPGMDTGLVVRVPKEFGVGYEVDTATLSALLDIELQALKITGQLTKTVTLNVVPKMLVGVDIEDV